MFLDISQNSQENTCVRVFFLIKLQACNFIKKRPWHRCFPVNFAKFKRTHFYRTPLGDCFYITTIFCYLECNQSVILNAMNRGSWKLAVIIWCVMKALAHFLTRENLLLQFSGNQSNIRNSHQEVFLGKGVLITCSIFTAEHSCRSVISIKLLWNLIETALRHGCSPYISLVLKLNYRNNEQWTKLKCLDNGVCNWNISTEC